MADILSTGTTIAGNVILHEANVDFVSLNATETINGAKTLNDTLSLSRDVRQIFQGNSGWNASLSVGGNGPNASVTQASIATTNGNLHLDSGTNKALYLNFYSGTEGVYFGNGAGTTVATMNSSGFLTAGEFHFNSGSYNLYFNYNNEINLLNDSGVGSTLHLNYRGTDSASAGGVSLSGNNYQFTTASATFNKSLSVTGSVSVSSQLKSTVTTGTAPLSVSSTTKVTNLNADLLDGYHTNSTFSSSWDNIVENIPVISSSGVIELGRYIDFHTTNSTADYDVRFDCSSADSLNISSVSNTGFTINNNTVWHGGNDGSGSGLDADKLDGLDSSSFLRSDVSDIVSPGRQISFQSYDNINNSTGDQASLEVYQDNPGADAFMQFHVSGDYALYFGLDGGTNDLAVGGWSKGDSSYKIWHAGNDGSGSGLDADLLDGYHASTSASGNTMALRDTSADVTARLFRSTYATQTSVPAATADIAFRNDNGSDNYTRFMTKDAMVSYLGISGGDGVSFTEDIYDIFEDNSSVMMYRMNGTVNDYNGNYNGTIYTGSSSSYDDGGFRIGKFGVCSYFSMTRIPSFNLVTSHLSLSMWVKRATLSTDNSIYTSATLVSFASNTSGYSTMMSIQITASNDSIPNAIKIWFNSNPEITYYSAANVVPANNEFFHVYIEDYDTTRIKLNINNGTDIIVTKSVNWNLSDYFTNNYGVIGGSWSGGNPSVSLLYIDQVRIFNRSLTSNEKNKLYTETPKNKTINRLDTNSDLNLLRGAGTYIVNSPVNSIYPMDISPDVYVYVSKHPSADLYYQTVERSSAKYQRYIYPGNGTTSFWRPLTNPSLGFALERNGAADATLSLLNGYYDYVFSVGENGFTCSWSIKGHLKRGNASDLVLTKINSAFSNSYSDSINFTITADPFYSGAYVLSVSCTYNDPGTYAYLEGFPLNKVGSIRKISNRIYNSTTL